MPPHRRVPPLAFLLAAACTLAAAPALADDPPPGPLSSEDVDVLRPIYDPPRVPTPQMVRRSVELYNEGVAHAQAGRLKDAYRAFRDAYEQDGSAESLGNAASIEASLGRPRSAADHLARAIGRVPADRAADAATLRARLDQVAKEIGTIVVRAPVGANVDLDGKWQGTGAVVRTFYVELGPHEVAVSAGAGEVKRKMQIKKGDKETIDVTPAQLQAAAVAALAPPAPPPAPTAAPAEPSRWPWIAGGGALALAATGGIGLGVYLRGHDERVKIDEQTRALGGYCGPTPKLGFADDCRARDQEARNETIGMVLAIAGLGGLGAGGAGALLAVLADTRAAPAAARGPVRFAVGPGTIVLQGSF